jgi:hypothetical protein
MFYDAMNVGQCLRRFISLNLGFWHTWKHLVGKIWYHFADEVFAPLHRVLSPNTHFHVTQSTPLSQSVMLVCVKEAYFAGPNVLLRNLIDANDFKRKPLADQTLLLDLYFLFECAIIVVLTARKQIESRVRTKAHNWTYDSVTTMVTRLERKHQYSRKSRDGVVGSTATLSPQ